MQKETTYNKYKRERQQLLDIVDLEVRDFALTPSFEEHKKRINHLREWINLYRYKQK